jgi:hypothetical protein
MTRCSSSGHADATPCGPRHPQNPRGSGKIACFSRPRRFRLASTELPSHLHALPRRILRLPRADTSQNYNFHGASAPQRHQNYNFHRTASARLSAFHTRFETVDRIRWRRGLPASARAARMRRADALILLEPDRPGAQRRARRDRPMVEHSRPVGVSAPRRTRPGTAQSRASRGSRRSAPARRRDTPRGRVGDEAHDEGDQRRRRGPATTEERAAPALADQTYRAAELTAKALAAAGA